MLEVANGKYSMTPKANADTKRSAATLVAVADRVLALLDWNSDLKKGLSTCPHIISAVELGQAICPS